MSDEPVPVGDAADPESVDLIAAALRADSADVATLVRVVANTLADTLPPGLVEVRRTRSLADRLAGRDGTPVAVTVSTPELRLSLTMGEHRHDPVRAEAQRVVRGVVISRQDLPVDEWVTQLARAVADLASRNAGAREALGRWLGA